MQALVIEEKAIEWPTNSIFYVTCKEIYVQNVPIRCVMLWGNRGAENEKKMY